MKLNSLNELLIHELKDLASGEEQLTRALPRMAKAAHSPELRSAFSSHLQETEGHLQRVKGLIERLEGSGGAKVVCAGIAGIIKEGDEIIDEEGPDAVRDAALIGAAQRVEHYEIAGYGTAKAFAEKLGDAETARVLDEILSQEKAADDKLTDIARAVNDEACVAT